MKFDRATLEHILERLRARPNLDAYIEGVLEGMAATEGPPVSVEDNGPWVEVGGVPNDTPLSPPVECLGAIHEGELFAPPKVGEPWDCSDGMVWSGRTCFIPGTYAAIDYTSNVTEAIAWAKGRKEWAHVTHWPVHGVDY